jgi:hypothetical protein
MLELPSEPMDMFMDTSTAMPTLLEAISSVANK